MLGGRNTDLADELYVTDEGRVSIFGATASPDIPGTDPFGYEDFLIAVFKN